MKNFLKSNKVKIFFSFLLVAVTFGFGISALKTDSAFFATTDNLGVENKTTTSIAIGGLKQYTFEGVKVEPQEVPPASSQYTITEEYANKDFTVIAVLDRTDGGMNPTYKWFKYNEGSSGYEEISESADSSVLKIRNVADSGKYYCASYIGSEKDATTEETPLEINITQKEITVTNAVVENIKYNETNIIPVNLTYSGIVKIDEVLDDVTVTGSVEIADGNVGKGKFVDATNIKVQLGGTKKENYKLVESFDREKDFIIDIAAKEVMVENWTAYNSVYNGQSQRSKIKPYFINKNEQNEYIPFKVVLAKSYITTGSDRTVADKDLIMNAGEYTLELSPTQEQKNYKFVDSLGIEVQSIKASITRKRPVVRFQETFVYTGKTIDVQDYIIEKDCDENQEILFKDSRFKDVADEEALRRNFKVTIKETKNYEGCDITCDRFIINKAETKVDHSEYVNKFKYSGAPLTEKQLTQGFKVLRNDNEPVNIVINVKPGIELVDAKEYLNAVTLKVLGNDNYKDSMEYPFSITILPKELDVSNLSWKVIGSHTYSNEQNFSFTYCKNTVQGVELSLTDDIIKPYYGDTNKKIDAGKYIAKVEGFTVNNDNYKVVGKVVPLIWEINKKQVDAPRLTSTNKELVFNNQIQGIYFDYDSSIIEIKENKKFNVGTYTSIMILKDPENYEWLSEDGVSFQSSPKYEIWRITPAILQLPDVKTSFKCDGNVHSISLVNEDERFKIIASPAKEAGDYEATLVLLDGNYKWDENLSENRVLTLKWHIIPQENFKTIPIIIIVSTTVVILVIGIFLTLHFTVVRKHKKLKTKKQKED